MTKKKSSIKQSVKWKWQFSPKNIEIVEKTCEKVIDTLGYTKFNKDFVHSRKQILSKKWKDIWPYIPSISSFFSIIKNTSTISNSLLFSNDCHCRRHRHTGSTWVDLELFWDGTVFP